MSVGVGEVPILVVNVGTSLAKSNEIKPILSVLYIFFGIVLFHEFTNIHAEYENLCDFGLVKSAELTVALFVFKLYKVVLLFVDAFIEVRYKKYIKTIITIIKIITRVSIIYIF
jgi:hypothetical protein